MTKLSFGRTDADLARAESKARDLANDGGVFRVVEAFEGFEVTGTIFVVDDQGLDEVATEYDNVDELLSFGIDPEEV